MTNTNNSEGMKISVQKDGPYLVTGGVPLVHKRQVVTEFGEPITWEKEGDIPAPATYELCRCGNTKDKPFCDYTHDEIAFDGTEMADTNTSAERRVLVPGGKQIVVHRDHALCIGSGFCGTRIASIAKMLAKSSPDDTHVRSQVIAMIERCPSGSFTYSLEGEDHDVEPDLPRQIAVTTETTSDGLIDGPLVVTGNIRIERADGQPLEVRNRVALCRCGKSASKPLCDGSHRPD